MGSKKLLFKKEKKIYLFFGSTYFWPYEAERAYFYIYIHFNSKGHEVKRDFRMIPNKKVHGDRDTLRIRERYYNDE